MCDLTANMLYGKDVTQKMKERIKKKIATFPTTPKLAIVRVGDDPSQISYENGCKRLMGGLGIEVDSISLPVTCTQHEFDEMFLNVNDDRRVDGIVLLQPLPKHLSDRHAKSMIKSEKDVDGIGDENMLLSYQSNPHSFLPCTAQACIEILKYLEIDIAQSSFVIAGYSLVVGKPLAVALLNRGARVKICQDTSRDLKRDSSHGEIVISAIGVPEHITASELNDGVLMIDVGINFLPDGTIVGDVDASSVSKVASWLTPVPRGVGVVTNVVLAQHVMQAYIIQHKL